MTAKTFSERAWLAYHSLPRRKSGKPPSQSELEEQYGLNKATFYKVFVRGRQVSIDTLPKLASALNVSVEWLTTGRGDPPTPSGYVPPMPGTPEALLPPSLVGDPSKARRRGDLPGWIEAETEARKKEPERFGWAIRGAREAVMQGDPQPGELNGDYVLALATLIRKHATKEEKARLEELEILDERAHVSGTQKKVKKRPAS